MQTACPPSHPGPCLCPADYSRFPYVSSFHIREATHLHVGEYSCKTRSLRAKVEERIYLYVNDQAWSTGVKRMGCNGKHKIDLVKPIVIFIVV